MTIIRYADIYRTVHTPEGLVENLSVRDATLHMIIQPDRVNTIQPYVSSKGSKIIFCGSKEQIDKSFGKTSCYHKITKLEQSGLVGFTTLKANHRNPVLTDIINYLENE